MQDGRPLKPIRISHSVHTLKKFSRIQVFFLVMLPTEYVQSSSPASPACKFSLRSLISHWGDVTDLKITLLSLQKVLQIQILHGLKIPTRESHNEARLQFKVTCWQFCRRLIYNVCLWGKCFLGHKGIPHCNTTSGHYAGLEARQSSTVLSSLLNTYIHGY